MKQQQRELRRAAAQAFMESLDQLQATLQTADSPASRLTIPSGGSATSSSSPSSEPIDLNSFEQAVADIEQFIQKRQQSKP